MKTTLLVCLLALPAVGAPKPLSPKQLVEADPDAKTLHVDCTDAYINRLARFKNLRALTLTGPYNNYY